MKKHDHQVMCVNFAISFGGLTKNLVIHPAVGWDLL